METNEILELQFGRQGKPLRVLICDDDRDSLSAVHRKTAQALEKMNIDAAFDLADCGGDITVEQLRSCDLALLDIDLECQEQSGIDVARRLREVNGKALIIFVTNFIEYAPEGYEVQAFRYILKRDLDAVLFRYLLQALEQIAEGTGVLRLQKKGQVREVALDQVLYMEVQGHSVSIFLRDGSNCTVNASLSSFEQQLEEHGFLRVHKSYLVNMRHIQKFQCRSMTLVDGSTLRVSEKSYAQQKRKYLLWKGWQP